MSGDPDHTIQTYKKFLVIIIVALVSNVLLFGLAFLGWQNTLTSQNYQVNTLNNRISELQTEISTLTSAISGLNPMANQSFTRIYDGVRDSVVTVQSVIQNSIGTENVQGSGFVYNWGNSLIIITNNHVVDQTTSLTISFESGNTYTASVLGRDPFSDIAILSTTAPPQILKPLVIASSSSLKVGQIVMAVGTPYGFTGSMTTGVVSQLGRTITSELAGNYAIADIIQTSTPINPGNSGGPLLNILGEVVGITSAIIAASQGLGFAVPSDTILRELPYLVNGQPYPHPWLGVQGIDMNYGLAKAISLNVTYGWMITSVMLLGPASQAGIRGGSRTTTVNGVDYTTGGDVIIAINSFKIRNGDDLSTFLEKNTRASQTITITIIRSSQNMDINLTLGIRPS